MLEIELPAENEGQASSWAQRLERRIMRLLLQHDERLFRHQFSLFFADSTLPQLPLFQQYDRYVKLRLLSNELLDDILPRIRRRLSMKTSHARLREEAPTRGDIDWPRTLERSWSISPGLPALQFETRLRQRSMETPENLLTVAILLGYQQELQQVIQENFADEPLQRQERSTLIGMDERLERELAAPYARQLSMQARQVSLDTLAQQVMLHLHPGPSPYRDLVSWWHRFTELRMVRAAAERAPTLTTRRSDEKMDAWLYELWIALECIHLLAQEGDLQAQGLRVSTDVLQCTFRWQERRFRFLYNRQLNTMTRYTSDWEHGPSSRPDYTIEREQPLEIRHAEHLIWREPSVILDAKYYLGGSDPTNTHSPIKKLLGDMTLLGAKTGILLFPRLPEPVDGHVTRTLRRTGKQYTHASESAQSVHLIHLQPDMDGTLLQQRLHAMLNLSIEQLPERSAPICQGILLGHDSTTTNGTGISTRTALCPKAHIGPGVFDLVNIDTDCLQNPRLCHIMGREAQQRGSWV